MLVLASRRFRLQGQPHRRLIFQMEGLPVRQLHPHLLRLLQLLQDPAAPVAPLALRRLVVLVVLLVHLSELSYL